MNIGCSCFGSALASYLCVLTSLGAAEHVPLNKVPSAVLETLEATRTRLESFYESQSFSGPNLRSPYTVMSSFRTQYQQDAFVMRCDKQYRFEILTDGRLIKFSNDKIFDAAYGVGRVEYDTAIPPEWEQEKARQVAKLFATAILGERIPDLGKVDILYNQRRNSPKFLTGNWMVVWSRVDKATDVPFEAKEDLVVSIIEDQGPYALALNMPARFAGANFTPVKEADVLPEAVAASKKMMQWGPVRGMFQNGTLAGLPAKSYLMIVKPNRWGHPEVRDIHGPRDLNARLAWVLWFPWYLKGQPPDPAKAPRALAVWIDAENKTWLGGDAGSF